MKSSPFLGIFLVIITLGLGVYGTYLYLTPHYIPKVTFVDLSSTLKKINFNETDYTLLFEQTGLSPTIIDELKATSNDSSDFQLAIKNFQANYLSEIQTYNLYMPPATFCQLIGENPSHKTKGFTLAPYHNGYIFLTNATHSFGWRHGHVGLVVDEIHGYTLEALYPGTVSCLQDIHKWEYYPTFKMMRLKDVSLSTQNEIAQYALAHLQGLPYNILGKKYQNPPKSTHCSLLIWQAFYNLDYNLDCFGGFMISPKDIACSPLLEVLQIYGFNPSKDW